MSSMSSIVSEKEEFRSGFVAVIGRPNAGKSSLLNKIMGRKVSIVTHKAQTTRNKILAVRNSSGTQAIYLDTPGFVDKSFRNSLGDFLESNVRDAAKDADVCLIVIDAAGMLGRHKGPVTEISIDNDKLLTVAKLLVRQIKQRGAKPPFVVALNKVDLLPRESLLPLIQVLYGLFSELGLVEIIPVSALTGDGIEQLEKVVSSLLPQGPVYYPQEETLEVPEEFLAAEIVREKLYLRIHEEVPYELAVQVERWEEREDLIDISAVILVGRESHKPIVIGKDGEMLKRIGTSARMDLEKILGIKICLHLFVRVEEEWFRSQRGLQKAGIANI